MQELYQVLNQTVENLKQEYQIHRLRKRVAEINALNQEMSAWSDEDLRAASQGLREDFAAHQDLDRILVKAFAVAREAAFRILGKKAFDVQIMGGLAIHRGQIVEMKAGEGNDVPA